MSSFGDELRRVRKRAGLSQELLAERAGLSPEAVSLLERGRRSPRMVTMRLLADALELDEPGRQGFFDAQVADDPAPATPAPRPLPMVSTPRFIDPFVGRETETEHLAARLGSGTRLITVTGPGGVGKTRLAAEVVAAQEASFPDGVRWLTLASLEQAHLLHPAVAGALGLRSEGGEPVQTLLGQLGRARLLVVFDGAEHLLEGVRDLALHLVTGTPHVTVLITSSHRLLLPGEAVLAVPPLATPSADADDDAVLASPAVRLFCSKAGLAERPEPVEVRALARISRRLDGLPLALELAAVRRRVLSLPELATALDRTLGILRSGEAGGDELTERVVGWSYRLLTSDEQLILQRMTVFTSFSHESLAAVCADRWDAVQVLDLMSSLLDKSLVIRFGADEQAARFTLFAVVRLFAAERLPAVERETVQQRHAAYFSGLCMSAEPELAGGDQQRWLDTLDREISNLRSALAWLGDHEPDTGLRAAAAVWRWCYLRGRYTEGRRWLTAGLASAPGAPDRVRASALAAGGMLAFLQCDYAEAQESIERARDLYAALGEAVEEAWCLTRLGSLARERGEYERARALHTEAVDLARVAGDAVAVGIELNYLTFACWIGGDLDTANRHGPEALRRVRRSQDHEAVVWGLVNVGVIARYRGELPGAELLLQEALDLSQRVGFREGVAWGRNQLGAVARLGGQLTRARQLQEASLDEHRRLGDRWRMSSVLDEIAAVAVESGDFATAAASLGAADRLREDIGTPIPAVERAERAETVRRTREALGPAYGAAVLAGSLR